MKVLFLASFLGLSGLLPTAAALAAAPLPPQPTAAVQTERRQRQVRQVQPESYSLARHPVTNQNERYWRNLLWTTALVEPQETYVAEALSSILALTTRPNLSRPQMETVEMALQVGTQLYQRYPTFYTGVGQQFRQTVLQSREPQWVAMALSGLAQGGGQPGELGQLRDRVKARFPKWAGNLFLRTTLQDINQGLAAAPLPPLTDLLNRQIAPNQPHLYVLCRRDRSVLCQAVLKDRQGQFVRQAGQLWSVPLLLRSIHGLGWNFIRGQTPQGIYRLEGLMPKSEAAYFGAYGQFPLVKLFMPFESEVREFLPGRKGRFTGSIQNYQSLLPPSWRGYFPIEQSYWAGKIGRSLFRIHGSGEAPGFFTKTEQDQPSFDWNPTIGCLSALELYDQNGQLQQADMPKILNALYAAGGQKFSGYLVVVEVPGDSSPVGLDQIAAMVASRP